MDTKWRKFSRSGGFKAILLLIVLGCAAAVGAITGYIPESNYFRDGLYGDVLSHSRFTDSETYAGELSSIADSAAEECITFLRDGQPDYVKYYYKVTNLSLIHI